MTSSGKVRVLHLIGSNFVGGPEKQILRHARDVASSPYEIWVGSFRDGTEMPEILAEARAAGLPTVELFSGRFSPGAVSELRTKMREHEISLLCTYHYKANILGKLASLLGTRHIAFVRGWTGETARVRLYVKLERFVLRTIDHVVCVSSAQARQITSWRGRRPALRVIGNAPAIDAADGPLPERAEAKKSLGVAPTAFVIGLVGRLSPEKGHADLFRAVPELRKTIPNLQVWILGEGQEKESLVRLAGTLGIADAVQFHGFKKEIVPWIQGMDILVQPSHTEGMPNSVLEAMALGTPVIASEVGGLPEMLTSGVEGTLVPPADSEALRSSIIAYFNHPELGRRHALTARERVRAARTTQWTALLALYDKALDRAASTEESIGTEDPYISVVMPVRNEEAHITEVLTALAGQDYPRNKFEIIVADGNSTDATAQVVSEFAKGAAMPVKLVANPKQLSSAGRNAGVRASQGEVIAFIDGHCRIPDGRLLRNMVEAFRRSRASVLCRPQPLNVLGNTVFQEALARTRATLIGHGADSTIFAMDKEQHVNPSSSGAVYTASVFQKIGMYDENFDACEDVEFNYRAWKAGCSGFSSPTIAVYYSPRKSLAALWKQLLRYGRGRYRFMRKHPEATTLAQLIPAGFLLWLVTLGLASPFSPMAAWAFGGTLLLYLSVVLGFAIHLSFRYGWHHLLISPAVYACIHGGLGMGFWQEAVLGRKPQPEAVCAFQRSPLPPATPAPEPQAGAELMSATSNKG